MGRTVADAASCLAVEKSGLFHRPLVNVQQWRDKGLWGFDQLPTGLYPSRFRRDAHRAGQSLMPITGFVLGAGKA